MIILEDSQLYKGIFWIKDPENIGNPGDEDFCFQTPCDSYGNFSDDIILNSKSGKSYNHEKTWNSLPRNLTDNQPYNYYPRGRVEINNGKAIIYCSPHICTDKLKDWIIQEYNLTEYNGIKSVKLSADGSEHYKCHLDW